MHALKPSANYTSGPGTWHHKIKMLHAQTHTHILLMCQLSSLLQPLLCHRPNYMMFDTPKHVNSSVCGSWAALPSRTRMAATKNTAHKDWYIYSTSTLIPAGN